MNPIGRFQAGPRREAGPCLVGFSFFKGQNGSCGNGIHKLWNNVILR